MPIFEYACARCGLAFERLVNGASTAVSCPSCRGEKVVKRFSVFGSKSGGKFTSSHGGGCTACKKASCTSCK